MATDRNESKNFEKANNAKECHRISISNKRVESESTVANFSPKHSGTEKDQRGTLCV